MQRLFLHFIVSLFVFITLKAQVVTTEQFESGLPTSAPSTLTSYSLSTGTWALFLAYQTTTKYSGTYALQVKSNGYAVTPSIYGVQTVSFWARGSGASTLKLQKSTNGADFTDVTTITISSSYAQYTISINETQNDVRLRFLNGTSQTHYIDDVMITAAEAPLIHVSVDSLPDFGKVVIGTSSALQTYTVSAVNLNGDVGIQAPDGFEVSLNGSTFSSSLVLSSVNGSLSPTTIYVRFVPAVASGTFVGSLRHFSPNARIREIRVSATSLAVEPTEAGILTLDKSTGVSLQLTISGGNGNEKMLVMRQGSSVTWVPEDGILYEGINTNFSIARDQGSGNKIVYQGANGTITVDGLMPNTEYACALYECNRGSSNSVNYLSVPATAAYTTLATASITATPARLDFGSVIVSLTSEVQQYSLSAAYLEPSEGTLLLQAPEGFEVAATPSSFSSSFQIPYSGGRIDSLTIFVRFQPVEKKIYAGFLTHSGGSATPCSVEVYGRGVEPYKGDGWAPVGFAAVAARGLTTTTGGTGGTVITVRDAATLQTVLRNLRPDKTPGNPPTIIEVEGTLQNAGVDMIEMQNCANITLLGKNNATFKGFGLQIESCSNIIVRNITFSDCPDDGIEIREPATHHIWIDHCTFTDGDTPDPSGSSHDGALDVKREATHVTISWNRFTNHSKTCLFGHSDNSFGDTVMCVTYHHNFFDSTLQRHPRVRYGRAHVFNNYYYKNAYYGIASTCDAKVYVEGNYFESVPYPIHVGYAESPDGYVVETNNIFSNCGIPVTQGGEKVLGTPTVRTHTWLPANDYEYTVDEPALLPTLVSQYAGAENVTFTTPGTMEVDGAVSALPEKLLTVVNYPNPFNPTTYIEFIATQKLPTTLMVMDVLGRRIATLYAGIPEPGVRHSIPFDARTLASGVYYAIVNNGGHIAATKMILTK